MEKREGEPRFLLEYRCLGEGLRGDWSDPLKILIVDDHAVVRRGLQQILADEFDVVEFGEAVDAGDALERIYGENWDVVILDISMPGRSGLDVLKDIRKEYPRLPVLVLSMHPEDQFATRVLKAGASGYMTKETAPEELVNAINKIVKGGKYVSSTLAESLASDLSRDLDGGGTHQQLSDREFQVLRLIASGMSVGDIGSKLALSPKTISTYRARILEKMGMKNNAELTHYAIRQELVD